MAKKEPNQRIGNTGKYLKYAFGEILLVVIGILIALSINNWNEKQKLIKNEKELIASLKKEITSALTGLNDNLEKNEVLLETAEKLIQQLKGKDELFSAQDIYSAFDYFTYQVDTPVLDRIIATNSNILMKNKENLADFRSLKNRYAIIEEDQFYIGEFWNSKVTDFYISTGIWAEIDDEDYQISLKELALDGYSKKQFRTILKIHKGLHEFWKEAQVTAAEKSQEILDILE
jgi:Family of unknown function (DUF6090)